MSLGDKYQLELQADAIIAQKGTEAEKAVLRAKITSELSSFGSSHSQNSLEAVFYRLSKIDLGNSEVRSQIKKFIIEERALKGGYMGADFEELAKIFERYSGFADIANKERSESQAKVTATARKEAQNSDVWTNPNIPAQAMSVQVLSSTPQIPVSSVPPVSSGKSLITGEISSNSTNFSTDKIQAANENFVTNNKSEIEALLKEGKEVLTGVGAGRGKVNPTTSGREETTSARKKAPPEISNGPALAYDVPNSPERKAYDADKKALEGTFASWKDAIAIAAKEIWSDEKEIKDFSETSSILLKTLLESMRTFEEKHLLGKTHTLSKSGGEYIGKLRNKIAEYYRGVSETKNQHYKNPFIALDILSRNIGMMLPKFPDRNSLLSKLDATKKQQIITLVDAKMKGDAKMSFEKALGEVLGNPAIKGAWDKVSKDGLKEYNENTSASIAKIDDTNLTPEQKASLAQLRDMYGIGGVLGGVFNWKDDNVQILDMIRDQALALGLGAAGLVLTSTGVGAIGGAPMVGLAAGAVVGGLSTTVASMTLEGKGYEGKKFGMETAINMGTFVAGGFMFKVVRGLEETAKIGFKTAVALEGAGDVAIGVSIDQSRAFYQDIDVSLIESLKDNLAWALLPVVIRGGSRLKSAFSERHSSLPEQVTARLNEAQARGVLGDTPGAERILRQTDADIRAVRAEEAPMQNPTSALSSFDKLSVQIQGSITSLKEGASIQIGDIRVTRKGNTYQVQTGNEPVITYAADKKGVTSTLDLIRQSTGNNERFRLATNKAINKMLEKNLGKEVTVGGKTYRFIQEAEGVVLQKKRPDGGYIAVSEAELSSLSSAELDVFIGHVAGNKALAWFRLNTDRPIQQTPAFERIKDIKVKDFFLNIGEKTNKFALHTGNVKDYSWIGARIPKYMYDWSIGRLVSELGHSVQLPGIKKVEVFRTLLTGRSSHGHLWAHHGGILPSAWTPSMGTIGVTGAITGTELYLHMNNSQSEDTRDWHEFMSDELKSNYFNYIWLGGLGTLLVESVDGIDLGKRVANTGKDIAEWTIEKVGTDGGKNRSK